MMQKHAKAGNAYRYLYLQLSYEQFGHSKLTFEFSPLSSARAFIHHALDIIGEDPVVVEDAVNVDIVILGGVLAVRGGGGRCCDEANTQNTQSDTHGKREDTAPGVQSDAYINLTSDRPLRKEGQRTIVCACATALSGRPSLLCLFTFPETGAPELQTLEGHWSVHLNGDNPSRRKAVK